MTDYHTRLCSNAVAGTPSWGCRRRRGVFWSAEIHLKKGQLTALLVLLLLVS